MRPRQRQYATRSLFGAMSELLPGCAGRSVQPLARARLCWPRACGAPLARLTSPVAWSSGVLRVAVTGESWLAALDAERPRLTARMRRFLPGLRRIDFVVRATASLAPAPVPPRPAALPDPRNAEVRDPALRAELDALCALYRARRAETGDHG